MIKYFVKYIVYGLKHNTNATKFFTTDDIEESWVEFQRAHDCQLEIVSITPLPNTKGSNND